MTKSQPSVDLEAMAQAAQQLAAADQRHHRKIGASALDLATVWREAELFRAARNLALKHRRWRQADLFARAHGQLIRLARDLLAAADTPTTH